MDTILRPKRVQKKKKKKKKKKKTWTTVKDATGWIKS
jgi:hypothetical protein